MKTGKLVRIGPNLLKYLIEMCEIIEQDQGYSPSLRVAGELIAKRLDNAGGLKR